jgi:cysteinyl-tRNA synthetase
MTEPQPKLQLFNTLSNKLEDFSPLEPGKVKMYVCGPTVYDDAHLGHARCYITWDVLYRFLKFLGYDVTYVRNVTDVDDKILNRAKERGELPKDVAERNYASFKADMAALNVLPPDCEPKATEYIGTMIEVIQGLIAKDAAYVAPDGTVYFRVSADSNYGQLSKKPLDELKSGARVDVDPNKESPLDFALWKSVPPEEQTDEKLSQGYCFEPPPNSGLVRGRPGWHIECSAMNYAILGPQIDIHAGGADLVFPHHENEIAQTETWQNLAGGPDDACANHRFAKYWLHNGFVNVSGEKMSKSLGNFSTIKKLLERYDANTIRYFLLTNKYRMPVDFNDEALQSSENKIVKIHRTFNKTCRILAFDQEALELLIVKKYPYSDFSDQAEYITQTTLALMEDLNTAKVLAFMEALLSSLNSLADEYPAPSSNPKKDSFFKTLLQNTATLFNLLGFRLDLIFNNPQVSAIKIPIDALESMIQVRKQAKQQKDWKRADEIRNQLLDFGLQILDNKDGTTTVEKDGLEIVRV